MKSFTRKFRTLFLMFFLLLTLCIPVSAATTKGTSTTKTTTTKETSTKKVTLSKKATKTYTKTLPTTTKTSTKTKSSSTTKTKTTVKTVTTVKTAVKEKYTKGSKKKTVTTTVTTTVKVTTTKTPIKKVTPTPTPKPTATPTPIPTPYKADVAKVAPKADARLRNAWNKLGFSIIIDPTRNASGILEIKTRTLTMGKENAALTYEELGNFLTWVAAQTVTTDALETVYAAEYYDKDLSGSTHSGRTPAVYFAETFKEYCLNKTATKAAKPKTCALIEKALASLTDEHLEIYNKLYKNFWAMYTK